MEHKEYEIPAEYQRTLSEILTDNETVVQMGDGKYSVKRLRLYSMNLIYQVMIDSLPSDKGDTPFQEYDLHWINGDMNRLCRVVAICLCNQYFTEENCDYTTPFEREYVMGRNEFMIQRMTDKVMLSVLTHLDSFQSILEGAFLNMDVVKLFLFASSVRESTKLAMGQIGVLRNQMTLQQVQSARLGKWATSSNQTPQ